MELLGKTVRDQISGLVGLAQGHVVLINGNVRYSVQPPGDGTKILDPHDIDEHSLIVVDDGPTVDVILPDANIAAALGDLVRDLLTGRQGIVDMVVTSVNGCTYLRMTEQASKDDKLKLNDSLYGTHDRFELLESGAFARMRAEANIKKKGLLERVTDAVTGKKPIKDDAPAAAPLNERLTPPARPPGGPTTRSLRC